MPPSGEYHFPLWSRFKTTRRKLREAMRRMVQCFTLLAFPLMVGIAACAHSILRLLYGPQWTPTAPYMMLACFSFALRPFYTINLRGIMALGRSDVFGKFEIIKKRRSSIVILSAFRLGVLSWMAMPAFVLGPFSLMLNAWPNRKLLDYTIGMQLRDVMSMALLCVAEVTVVVGVGMAANAEKFWLGVPDECSGLLAFLDAKLALQFISGSGIFLGIAYAFHLRQMGEYACMAAGCLQGRMPKIAAVLQNRFET